MDFWLGLFMGGAIGAGFGALYSHRARRFWRWRLGRKLQLIAARNEMKGYRQKSQRPVLANWQKCLLGWLHSRHPTLTRYTNFRPETLLRWHRRFVKYRWSLISWAGKRSAVGRPRLDASIEKIIIDIKAENPRYGAKRISAIVSKQLGVDISETSVRNVLAHSRLRPKTPSSPRGGQRWKTFLANHCGSMASMDFKVTFDWRGKPLYVFNIIDHERRELVTCRATSNPSSDWVAQQIREAYPFDEAPKRMLMDHDSMFAPLIARTLPNMGIKVMRSSVGCPWQNGVVERFNLENAIDRLAFAGNARED